MNQRGAAGQSIPVSFPVEPLESRRLFAAQLGININNFGGDDYGDLVQMLHDSGTTSVRLWYGFDNYQERTLANVAKYVQKFAHDGFSVTLSVNPRKGRHGSYDETRDYFDWLVAQPGMAESVDLWEIGNEPNSQTYWKGDLQSYVSDYLAPASKALHAAGETVVSGGVAWNPDDIKTMVDAGMLKYVDYVGYHPYRPSVPALKKSIAAVESYVDGKPLAATEWNIRGHEDDPVAWSQGIYAFWQVIRDHFAVAHYFAARVQDSPAGPAGVLKESGKPNRPFYNVYMSLQDVGQPVDNGGDGGGDDGGGNTSSSDGDGDNSGSGSGVKNGGSTSSGGKNDGDTNNSGGSSTDGDNNNSGGTSTDGDGNNSGNGSGVKNGGSSSKGGSSTGSSGSSSGSGTTVPQPAPSVPTPPPPAISSLSLLNATRDRVIKPYAVISGAATIDLAATGTADLSFLASANKRTQSVVFTIGGNTVVDSDGQFTPFGDTAGNINGVDLLPGHLYVLTAQAFSGLGGSGKAGEVMTYVINVINTGDPLNTTTVAEAQAAARAKAVQIAKRNRLTPPTQPLPGLE